MSKKYQGKIKTVLSGDSLVLVNPNHKGKTSPEERIVSLAQIQAPRSDELFAFESREYLRNMLVGKTVSATVLGVSPSGREFVQISSPAFENLAAEVVSNGFAKVRARDDEAEALKEAESKAKAEQLGIWSGKGKAIDVVDSLSEKEIEKSKSSPLRTIVEKVFSGDRLKVRVLLEKFKHAEFMIHIAGVRSPVTSPFAEQAKYYIELFELAKVVNISIIGQLSNGVYIAKVATSLGNLTDRLLKEGLAEVDDRQSISIGSAAMSHLRTLQASAKQQGKGQWATTTTAAAAAPMAAASLSAVPEIQVGAKFSATVFRVISADTIRLTLGDDKELTVSLTSLRGPRQSDPNTAPFIDAAREFVRRKAIGKKVTVKIEAIKPKADNFEEKPLVDIILPNGTSLAAAVIESGWATAIRHRRDDTDRSPQWDLFLELEQTAINNKKGIHGKAPEVGKIVEASENKARAASLLHSLKNKESFSAIVEAVLSANRFRIYIPRESMKLTLVLGGLGNISSSSPELAAKALSYVSKKALQRDVHVKIYSNDSTGAFIGNLIVQGQNSPLQVALLSQGLAKIHDYSVSQTGYDNEFLEAQKKAQSEKNGYWKENDPAAAKKDVEQVRSTLERMTITPKYHNVKITSVSNEGTLFFRSLDNSAEEKFLSFQNSFRGVLGPSSKPKGYAKVGELVAAKDSENGKFYRARVLSAEKDDYLVQHIDFGLVDSISGSSLYSLPGSYAPSVYPAAAKSAKLALVHLPARQPYLNESLDFIDEFTEDASQLVAVEYRANPGSQIDYDISLVNFALVQKGGDKNDTLNRQLVKNGFAIVDREITPFEKALKAEYDHLIELQRSAKAQHIGCWQYGDIEEDDDM